MSLYRENLSKCLTIVVSGEVFEMKALHAEKFPDTLLGNPNRRNLHLDASRRVYFFDRHRLAFEGIFFFYQSNGKIICPENVPYEVFQEELKFFGIKEISIPETAKAFIFHPFRHAFDTNDGFKNKLWRVLSDPNSSHVARAFSVWSFFVTIASIVLAIINKSDNTNFSMNNPILPYELVCFVWFTIECILRFFSSPSKKYYFRSAVDIIDVFSVFIFYVALIVETSNGSSMALLRVFRVANIFRILKLTRYFYGLRLLLYTIYTSRFDLQILGACLLFFILLSSSIMFFAETGEPRSSIDSIPNAIWWAIVTCTTVGYGDAVPFTTAGKFVGACTAIFGALMVLMPVLKFVQSFGDALLAAKPYLRNLENSSKKSSLRF